MTTACDSSGLTMQRDIKWTSGSPGGIVIKVLGNGIDTAPSELSNLIVLVCVPIPSVIRDLTFTVI
jgi:hypothetical protein